MCGLSSGRRQLELHTPASPVRRSPRGSAESAPQTPPQLPPRTSATHHAAALWDAHLRNRPQRGANTSASGAPEAWLTDYTDAQLQHNLKMAPWLGFGSGGAGIWPLEAPAAAAHLCGAFLEREWLPTGKLHLQGGPPLEGYNSYPTVRLKADKRLQQAQTLVIGRESVARAMKYIPGFTDIAGASAVALAEANILDMSRLELGAAHMLLQGPDSDRSTAFAMHRDTEDDPKTVYTSITMLTPTPVGTPPSQMAIAGGTPFSYGTNAGSGCYFLADFYHASRPSVPNARFLKVAMFWYVNPPQVVRVKPKKKRRNPR